MSSFGNFMDRLYALSYKQLSEWLILAGIGLGIDLIGLYWYLGWEKPAMVIFMVIMAFMGLLIYVRGQKELPKNTQTVKGGKEKMDEEKLETEDPETDEDEEEDKKEESLVGFDQEALRKELKDAVTVDLNSVI